MPTGIKRQIKERDFFFANHDEMGRKKVRKSADFHPKNIFFLNIGRKRVFLHMSERNKKIKNV